MGINTALKRRESQDALAQEGVVLPDLRQELRECLADIRHNQMLFDLETEPELIEQRIYEREALQCRYQYLLRKARASGLRAIL